jgi:tetratricopeptide (TPR) repeat protein
METYDRLGEIYKIQKNYPQALNAFQKGLELAKAISYKEEYFSNKIVQVNQQINPPQQPPANPSPQ